MYGGGGSDAFVVRIDRFRRLGYAGFLGGSGSDVGHGLALDRSGSAHVVGTTDSDDFPVVRALQDRRADFKRLGWLVRLAAEEPESEPGPRAGAGARD